MSLIQAENVKKSFAHVNAVDGVSLNIEKGDLFGLLGPNGAGKSTMISMLSTLLKPDSGQIIINGWDIAKDASKIKKLLGLVPQEIALYPSLTAKENLVFWGRMYGLGGAQLRKSVEKALEIAGLGDRAGERIYTYSGGMKRRINIAAALLHDPQIVIMDEPTVGIDPQSRNHILETVLNLRQNGTTVIYTSHYMEEIEYLCTKISIMDYGKVIAQGTKEELKMLINQSDVITMVVHNANQKLVEEIKKEKGISDITYEQNELVIVEKDGISLLPDIIAILNKNSYKADSIDIKQANLEHVFLYLTGRVLRD